MLLQMQRYMAGLQEAWGRLDTAVIHQVIQILHQARLQGQQIFIMGNGGSAATASHFACDLAKGTVSGSLPFFRVMALTDNVALMTAYANDQSYEHIFAGQLANWVQPDDIVIGISTSGQSPNVLRATALANERGATTIGLTGFDGGMLAPLVTYSVHVPCHSVGQAEDIHLMLIHVIIEALVEIARE